MTLPELIKALEAADGPIRELDYTVDLALGLFDDAKPLYTSVIDAAVNLVDRVLPGYCFSVQSLPEWAREGLPEPIYAAYTVPDTIKPAVMNATLDSGEAISVHKVPAIALCLAVLRARLSQDGGGDE